MALGAPFPFPPLVPRDTEEAWFPRLESGELELLAHLETQLENKLLEIQTIAAPTPIGVVERHVDDEDEDEDEEASAEEEVEEEEDEETEFDDEEEELDLDEDIEV